MRIHAIQDSLKPEFSRTTNTEETHTEPKDTVPSTNHAVTDDNHTTHADTYHTEDHEPSREPDVVEDEAESLNRASASSKRPRSSRTCQRCRNTTQNRSFRTYQRNQNLTQNRSSHRWSHHRNRLSSKESQSALQPQHLSHHAKQRDQVSE